MQQRTDEWLQARLGKLTASRMADVLAKTKTGYSTSRENYAMELALERITGTRQEGFTSAAMQLGTDTEPYARAAYEMQAGVLVQEVGFIDHPSIAMTGASPDGLIGPDGLLEIKCPDSKQHLSYLRGRMPPKKYQPQMAWQLICTGRKWCDFVSYDPRMPEGLQLFVTRYTPTTAELATMEEEAKTFLSEVAAIVQEIETIKTGT